MQMVLLQSCLRWPSFVDLNPAMPSYGMHLMHSRADYPFQVDYAATWANTLHSYRTLADACAPLGVNVSIEWKPTDPASRNSFISNTATALLLAQGVDRPNFGLALDAGHMLMAGESWAGSIVAVANAGKLFGLHLNDGHARMGGEDGLTFGSVHATGGC